MSCLKDFSAMFVEKTQRCLLNDTLLRTQTVTENS